jgi:hypothetical protein
MKNTIVVILLILLYSCGNKKAQVKPINKDSLVNISIVENKFGQHNNIENLLIGAWAENEEDNALFSFDGQYINYTESTEPYTYKVIGDTVIINLDPIAKLIIIKITKDSLWFTDNFNTDTTRLYRR